MYLCNMKVKILQSIADSIIRGLSETKHDDIAEFYYKIGIWFDGFCIQYFDVYLE